MRRIKQCEAIKSIKWTTKISDMCVKLSKYFYWLARSKGSFLTVPMREPGNEVDLLNHGHDYKVCI